MTAFASPAEFTWILAIALSTLAAILMAMVFIRRAVHSAIARRLGRAQAACRPLIDALVAGNIAYEQGLQELSAASADMDTGFLQRLLLVQADAGSRPAVRGPSAERLAIVRSICTDLGLVSLWRRQLAARPAKGTFARLFGRRMGLLERIPHLSFVVRAEAAENLGIIRDQPSWPLLAEALSDPHLTVRSAAARALATIQDPSSFPILVEKLRATVLDREPDLSLRSLTMALASFPLAETIHLADLLQHPNPHARFRAADIIATMVQRAPVGPAPEQLPREVVELFLTALHRDPDPDVRARAADVIGRQQDLRAKPALLVLLEDPEWFVRLHAARALGAWTRPAPLAALSRRLTDSNWRVREAAAQALSAQGPLGVRRLLDHFLETEDRYSKEQVAEQMERSGLIPAILSAFGDPGRESETGFIEGIIRLGKTEALQAALENGWAHKRHALVRKFRSHPDSGLSAFVQQTFDRTGSQALNGQGDALAATPAWAGALPSSGRN